MDVTAVKTKVKLVRYPFASFHKSTIARQVKALIL